MSVASSTEGRSDLIMAWAARLFAVKGFEATSMNDIAVAVGVSKSLIYHYFKSKSEILYLMHRRLLDEAHAMVDKAYAMQDDPRQRFENIVRGHARLVLENIDSNLAFTRVRGRKLPAEKEVEIHELRERYLARVEQVYRDGVASSLLRDMNSSLAVSTIFAASNWLYRWTAPQNGMSVDDTIDELVEFVGHGVFTD